MRNELWLLRNRKTGELVLEYWASSQKHKAIFATEQNAMKACQWKHNQDFEPVKVTAVSLYAADGCYCGECTYWNRDKAILPDGKPADWGYCEKLLDADSGQEIITSELAFCRFGNSKRCGK